MINVAHANKNTNNAKQNMQTSKQIILVLFSFRGFLTLASTSNIYFLEEKYYKYNTPPIILTIS
jgi:hypothetical protein